MMKIPSIVRIQMKLISTNRIALLYFSIGLIIIPGLIFALLSEKESDGFTFTTAIYFFQNFLLLGFGNFFWRWDSKYYKLFIIKGKIKALITGKLYFYYLVNFLNAGIVIFLFWIFQKDYYLQVSILSALFSLGFPTLAILVVLSRDIMEIDLFDQDIFVIPNTPYSYLAIVLLILFAVIVFCLIVYLQFIWAVILGTIFSFIPLLLFFNKAVNLISMNVEQSQIKY